jgi:hypothetical protein
LCYKKRRGTFSRPAVYCVGLVLQLVGLVVHVVELTVRLVRNGGALGCNVGAIGTDRTCIAMHRQSSPKALDDFNET